MPDPITPTEWLARHCVVKGLRLRDAVALFEALYIADAIAAERGNVTAAAARAGVSREMIRLRRPRR